MSIINKKRWATVAAIGAIVGFLILHDGQVQRAQALPQESYQELETFVAIWVHVFIHNRR